MTKSPFIYFALFILGVSILICCKKDFQKELVNRNNPPIANAGNDTIIVLPQKSILLDGSMSDDPDGTINKYSWLKVSGPSTFKILDFESVKTIVEDLVKGTYQFELTVTDNGGLSSKDTVMITVDSTVVSNHAPIANAGADQTITLPNDSAMLDASQSADPDNNIASYHWTKIAGPLSFSIASVNAIQTPVASLVEGDYQFELNVTDSGGLFAKDTIKITVNPATSANHSPIANAGPDQELTLPASSAILDGSGSYDADNNIAGYIWTNVSGPSLVQIANTASVQAEVASLVLGVYQFELKVTDSTGLSSVDTVVVTVKDAVLPTNCASNREEINASMTLVANLSKPRAFMAVAAAGNKIVFAGGTSEDPPSERYGSSRVDIFDIANQSWSTAELSVPRSSITAISAGNKIFFAGGYAGELGDLEYYYSTVDIYDVSTNSWSVANLSEPRIGMAAATVGNKVYFAGGYNNGSCSNKVDIYDISSGTWSLTALSESKAGISAVSHQNKIYFAGGSNGIFFSNRIDIYDNASNSWSTSSLSEPKSGMAGVASGDKIYWSGGYNGQGPLCKVEIRDLLTQTTSFDHLSNNQFSITAVLKNGVLAFIPADGVKFDIHNPISNSWTVGVKPINTIYASIISINNNLYLAGGISSNNNAYSREVWKLEF